MEWAREVLPRAQTVEQLRQAQSVVLPLDYGLSLEQTARAIGSSVPWTCRLRSRFLAGEIVGDGRRQQRGGRRRQNMSAEQERELLAPFLERASTGGILVVGQITVEIEARLGRSMALSSVYNLLHRHGWRKGNADQVLILASTSSEVIAKAQIALFRCCDPYLGSHSLMNS